MRPFIQLLAAWIKKTRRDEIIPLFSLVVDDAIESAPSKPARDKLAKKVTTAFGERMIQRSTKGAEFTAWLDGVMGQVGQEAGLSGLETLAADRVYLEGEDPLVVSVRYVGDSQDSDTEVPAYLSHRDLDRVLMKMGGKASCDWLIREVDAGFGRELRTVYSCRVTFPMKELAAELIGASAIGAAVDRALGARSGARKKTPSELDREIAAALAVRRGSRS